MKQGTVSEGRKKRIRCGEPVIEERQNITEQTGNRVGEKQRGKRDREMAQWARNDVRTTLRIWGRKKGMSEKEMQTEITRSLSGSSVNIERTMYSTLLYSASSLFSLFSQFHFFWFPLPFSHRERLMSSSEARVSCVLDIPLSLPLPFSHPVLFLSSSSHRTISRLSCPSSTMCTFSLFLLRSLSLSYFHTHGLVPSCSA